LKSIVKLESADYEEEGDTSCSMMSLNSASRPRSKTAKSQQQQSKQSASDYSKDNMTSRPYTCDAPNCGKTFRTRQHLNRHRDSVHLKIKIRCPYPGCDKEFSEREILRNHQKIVHMDLVKYRCEAPSCGFKTNHKGNWRKHLSIHPSQSFTCDFPKCGKNFTTQFELKRHRSEGHMSTGKYVCAFPNCGFSSNELSSLKSHEQLDHDQDGRVNLFDLKWSCKIEGCDEKFPTKRQLTIHVQESHK